jgi:hypothetical protein
MNRFDFRTLSILTLALGAPVVATGCSGGAESRGAADGVRSTEQAVTTSRAPTLLLTPAVLTRLQSRAAASDPAWTALKAHCDLLATGTANIPSGNAYPDYPDVGQGYEGDGYLPEVLALGLCYQTISATDASTAATYATAGDQLLQAISTPPASGGQSPSTDDGYGIRNYGVALAFGFDWLYSGLQASTRSAVLTALDSWIDWYDSSGFSNNAPVGNYFAGFILAKAAAGIATGPDNTSAAGYWSSVQTTMYPSLLQAIYAPSMSGGGWPEGWEYGPLAVENYALFFWAVESGEGLDWFDQIPHVHDEARYMSYFAWPSLRHMDDQGTIHSGVAMTPSGMAASAMASMLAYHGDSYAPTAKSFASALLATSGDDALDPWQAFLYVDSAQPQGDYTAQPLSYFATGPNHVAVRSTWQTDAVWGSFVPGTYIDSTDSGEQGYNSGAVAIVSGDTPILANATGQLPQVDGTAGENLVYADAYNGGTRQLNNTFGATGVMQGAFGPSDATTHAQGYEDNGTFVHARGVQLEQMYEPSGVVSQWTRDFAYVRPGVFVVYDRTTTNAADNWVSWHTEVAPTSVAVSDTTQERFDVTGGSFRMLLPRSATVKTVPVAAGITRLETHSPNASENFLTVVTAGTTPDEVRLSAADGNVASGPIVGVHVLGARNAVVLFNTDHAAQQTTSSATYTVAQTATADHVLFDMTASTTGYSVTAVASGSGVTVTVSPGGSFQLTAQNTLAFVVNTDGSVAPSTTQADGGAGASVAAPPAASAPPPASAPSSAGSPSQDDASAPEEASSPQEASSPEQASAPDDASSPKGSSSPEDASSRHHTSTESASVTVGIEVPPGGGANALPDPGFESGVNGLEQWPGGSAPSLTTNAIDGQSSALVSLASSSDTLSASFDATGTGVVHATALARNEGTATAHVKMCAGVYDQNWNDDYACSSFALAPGAVTRIAAAYSIPAGTTAQMTTWLFSTTSGAATFALDDAYLGYAPN